MLEHSPGPFTLTPNRWLGRDTCKAARSRRLHAALPTRATVPDQIRSSNILGPGIAQSPAQRTFFWARFGPFGEQSFRSPPPAFGPEFERATPFQPRGFFRVCQERKPPPALRISSSGLGAYENVTQLVARSCC